MSRVKIGILGAGFAAAFHMMAYAELPDVEVVAVGSRTQARAERLARRWGIKRVYYGEGYVEKLIKDKEVDAVDITLPNFLHAEAATLAAENHKNVICEKPLGRNSEEAKRMLDAVKRYGVLHAYAENQLFIPQIERVKEFIVRGAIGKVLWVRSREAHFGPHSAWFWDPELSGGGVLLDMGCHSVEVARYLIGGKPVEVFAWGDTLWHKTRAEDNSLILVRYEGGELGQSENSWTARGGLDIRFEIYGSEGAVFVDVTRETGIKVFTVASEEKVGYIVEKAEAKRGWMFPIWREHELYGYLNELRHFTSCFSKGEMPKETFEDGHLVNLILDAGYKSMKSKAWERVG